MAVFPLVEVHGRLKRLVPVHLKPDLGRLSPSERKALPHLIEAVEAMDPPFWVQNYGDPAPLLASIPDTEARRYVRLNYGPWDRWHQNEPILPGFGGKPQGANFYPPDITRAEFESSAAENSDLRNPFTMVRREAGGILTAIPYHRFFRQHIQVASEKLRQAAQETDSSELSKYLLLRAEALTTDDYRNSDLAWLEMKSGSLDLLIGPMEIEDRLFGIKTAYSGLVLIKDLEAGSRLANYTSLLPRFQESLPVPDPYKRERPGLEADLQVYDVLHSAGLDGVEPPRGVAWPDDEEVHRVKGFRAMLLANVMRAKFETILLPLADLFIGSDQRSSVRHDALFDFILFHELAHGLGVKNTLRDRLPVRVALGDLQHAVEEGKADLLGHHIAIQLHGWGLMDESSLLAVFVSSLLNLLYNYEGRQSIARLNYFKAHGAYSRDPGGTYRVHLERVSQAVGSLLEIFLRLQGDGDYEGAVEFFERYGQPDSGLKADIDRFEAANLPLGIIPFRD